MKKAPGFIRELIALIGRFVMDVVYHTVVTYIVSIPYRKVRNLHLH